MNERDREKAFEEILCRALRLRSSVPITECPEPNLLAAYFDHSLSVEETARLDTHFSACERCHQVLTTLAATEEQPAEYIHVAAAPMPAMSVQMASVGFKRAAALHHKAIAARPRPFLNWRWLAPAAAAAAFVLWFSLRPAAVTEQARLSSDQIATSPAPPAEETPSTLQGNQSAGAITKSDLEKKADPIVALNSSRATLSDSARRSDQPGTRRPIHGSAKVPEFAKVAPESPAPVSEPGQVAARISSEPTRAEHDQLILEQKARAQSSTGASQAPTTQPALAANTNEKQEAPSKSSEQARTALSKPSPKPFLDLNAKESRKKNSDVAAPAPAPGIAAVGAFRTPQADTPHRNLTLRLLPSQQVSAPGSTTLWRFGPGGLIERSLDAGQSWQSQASRVTTELLAGSAPADNVCWIVGRGATILRTTDDQQWEKISSPAEKDWISVVARSASAATITSRDSHRYSTTDGGRTWRRQ